MSVVAPLFPAIGLRRDRGRYALASRERLTWFLHEEDFSTCTSWEVEHNDRLGMILCDTKLRCWRVEEVIDLGIVGPFWERVWRSLNHQSLHRIDQKLVPLKSLSLEQIKERVCVSIQANPDDWRDDEAIAGEVAPPRDEQEMLDELKARVRAAQSLPQLINAAYNEELPG